MKKNSLIVIIGSLAASAALIIADYMGYQKGVDDVAKKSRAAMLDIVVKNNKEGK